MSSNGNDRICKSVVLEIRPRLQSVNVLIGLTQTINKSGVSVVLNTEGFDLCVNDDDSYKISCKHLKIVPNSLSSLSVRENSISFRFATANSFDDLGSFKAELMKASAQTSSSFVETTFLSPQKEYKIACRNCTQNLTDSLQFDRVLPLPSENSEPSDWFCHAHSSTVDLNPKMGDIFYAQSYFHLCKESVANILSKDKVIVCKRCLSWLGLVQNTNTVKFWFNTVTFTSDSISYNSNAIQDTYNCIRGVLSNILFNTAKIMLSCQSSSTQTDYILLWILEKQLNVHIYNSKGECKMCDVAKVLFKYECNTSDVANQWKIDSNINVVQISKPMFVDTLKHLHKYNKMFPKEFSESNNFYISYLMMYDESDE